MPSPVDECFYEKVINVKADVAALLIFLVLCGFRHISAENFALGSLRSDDWQLGRPTAPPLLSVFRVFSPPNASSLPCCIDPVVTGGGGKGAREGRFSLPLTAPPGPSSYRLGPSATHVRWGFVLRVVCFCFLFSLLPALLRTVFL